MVNGDCKKIREAAEKCWACPRKPERALGTPHVAEHLRLQTVRRLGIAAARAGHNKVEPLDIDPELVRDHASSFVLGLAGIAPASTPSVSLNIEGKAGYVIFAKPWASHRVMELGPASHRAGCSATARGVADRGRRAPAWRAWVA
jgi:hypothetical protein